MNRSQFGVVVLALLAVIALSIAAATIQTPITASGGSNGASGDSSTGNGTGHSPNAPTGIDVPVFGSFFNQKTPNMTGTNATGEIDDQSGGDARGAVERLTPSVPTVLLALLVLVLGGGVLAVLRMRGRRDTPTETTGPKPEPETDESATVDAIGQSAGAAADRLDDPTTTPENVIYRAWYEMTQHLDVANPTTTTTGQFAAAARDAGMRSADVAELTAQFETVRYGGASLTDERTDRAVTALRRIEDEYADANENTPEREDEHK